MKTQIITVIMITLIPGMLFAQNEESNETQDKKKENYEIKTLAKKGGKFAHGGYFAHTAHYSKIAGEDAFTIGARFGYMMDHAFTIGFAGCGFINDIRLDNVVPGKTTYLQGGYGGLFLEPTLFGWFPVHVTFPVMIGGGAIVYNTQGFYSDFADEDNYDDWDIIDSDAFFVIEPGVNLEFNVTSFFRIGVETTYRYVNGLQMMNSSSHMLNSWSGGMSIKFGKF